MAIHLGALEYTRYILNINLYGLREFHKRYYIREIVFYVSRYLYLVRCKKQTCGAMTIHLSSLQ